MQYTVIIYIGTVQLPDLCFQQQQKTKKTLINKTLCIHKTAQIVKVKDAFV